MNNGIISHENCQKIAIILNHLLANEYVLYTKTWNFHWNIEGQHFSALHLFLDVQRKQLEEFIDEVAERVRGLDIKSDGTLTAFLQKTALKEKPGHNPDDLSMLSELLADHETIIVTLRKDCEIANNYGDYGTNNFLADLLEKHEKMAWMLRAHIK
jgi:starvation-inducible DNA-binding protein